MLSQQELENISQFIGYGTLEGSIWFLGMEEAFQPRPGFSHEDNLHIHATFSPVIDVQEAHARLHAEYWKGRSVKVSHVWKWAAKLTRALVYRADNWAEVNKANHYIRTRFGRDKSHGGDILLADLLPFPKRAASDWPEDYKPFYLTRESYEIAVRPARILRLKALIHEYRPQVLVCYGASNYLHYKQILGDSVWLQQGLGQQNIHVKRIDTTLAILLPFMGDGALSTASVQQMIDYVLPQLPITIPHSEY